MLVPLASQVSVEEELAVTLSEFVSVTWTQGTSLLLASHGAFDGAMWFAGVYEDLVFVFHA